MNKNKKVIFTLIMEAKEANPVVEEIKNFIMDFPQINSCSVDIKPLEYDFMDMLREIDKNQPVNARLNAEQWAKAEEMLEDIKKYRKTIYKRDEKGTFIKN